MGVVIFVNLALMGCCLGEIFNGTTARFSSRDNQKSLQEPFKTYIAETSSRTPFVTHLPDLFTLIASCPMIYITDILRCLYLGRQMSTLLFHSRESLINTLQGLTTATQLSSFKSLRVGQKGRTLGCRYHGLDWRLLVYPLNRNWTNLHQKSKAEDRSISPDAQETSREPCGFHSRWRLL